MGSSAEFSSQYENSSQFDSKTQESSTDLSSLSHTADSLDRQTPQILFNLLFYMIFTG